MMVSQDSAICQAGLECTTSDVAGQCTATRMHMVLVAAMTVAFALALSTAAHAATIKIDSLADTHGSGWGRLAGGQAVSFGALPKMMFGVTG
jgi:hypothetical protein